MLAELGAGPQPLGICLKKTQDMPFKKNLVQLCKETLLGNLLFYVSNDAKVKGFEERKIWLPAAADCTAFRWVETITNRRKEIIGSIPG